MEFGAKPTVGFAKRTKTKADEKKGEKKKGSRNENAIQKIFENLLKRFVSFFFLFFSIFILLRTFFQFVYFIADLWLGCFLFKRKVYTT